jgi:hypothetical protein
VLRKKLSLAAGIVMAFAALTTASVAFDAGLCLSYTTMANVNSLVVDSPEGGSVSPDLHLGVGGQVTAAFDLAGSMPPLFVQFSALTMSSAEREAEATAGLVGIACGVEMGFGAVTAAVGASLHRGSFDFPAARQLGLSGWGAGLVANAKYSVKLSPRLEASFGLQGQWLPVTEMVDGAGQTYLGRGMPYLDFSGVSASICIGWMP